METHTHMHTVKQRGGGILCWDAQGRHSDDGVGRTSRGLRWMCERSFTFELSGVKNVIRRRIHGRLDELEPGFHTAEHQRRKRKCSKEPPGRNPDSLQPISTQGLHAARRHAPPGTTVSARTLYTVVPALNYSSIEPAYSRGRGPLLYRTLALLQRLL